MINYVNYVKNDNRITIGTTGMAFAVNYIINNLESAEELTKVRDWAIELERMANVWITTWTNHGSVEGINASEWYRVLHQWLDKNPMSCFKMDSPHKKAFLLADLGKFGYPSAILEEYYVHMMKIRDVFIVPKANYVYMKLETGGLAGYIAADRITGAKDYPILQVTWAIDNNPAKLITIHHDETALNNMSEWCIREHKESGLWDKCLESTVSLEDATNIIIDSFKEAGLVATNYQTNTSVLLVSYSSSFVSAFLRNQLRRVNSYFHMQTIDVLKTTSYALPMREYGQVFVPALYGNNSIDYVESLREFTNGMGYTAG